MNEAGILQISPASPYVGLTSSFEAGQDEPERFYPSGKRTFVRLQPGDTAEAERPGPADALAGRAQAVRARRPGPVRRAAGEHRRQLRRTRGHHSGRARQPLDTSRKRVFTGEVEKIVASHAQAVFLAGGEGAGTVALWKDLHEAAPSLLLFGSSALASESFTSQIGGAEAETYLTTPVLPARCTRRRAAGAAPTTAATFGGEGDAYALYGYEAMTVVLDAVRGSGARGNDRQTVIDRVLRDAGTATR